MLLRISLILAIIAGLAAGGLAYMEVTDKIPALTKQRDDENSAKKQALTELASTKNTLKRTQSDLAQTQSDLADTKADRDKEAQLAEDQTKRANDLNDKLAKATADLADTQNQLAAYKATDLTPDQVIKLNKNLKDANSQIEAINLEKTVLQREIVRVKDRLLKYEDPDAFVKLRADLKGKIEAVDPKWDFVVLNIGDDQGAVEDGEMLVSREGKLVAKVIIRSVQKDRCIANIVPGWKLGDPIEGDEVTPAHPAS
jgi:multidrug efflux pump subunit AcrA (membrane-fusion protein)